MQWTKAYQDAAGEPLAFLHFDVVWSGAWRQQLALLAPRLHAAGIRTGVIYDGDADNQSDLAWTSHAEQRFSAIEADPTISPTTPSCKPGCRTRPACCRKPSRAR